MFRGAVSPQFIFMEDNKRPYRIELVEKYLEVEDIQKNHISRAEYHKAHLRSLGKAIAAHILLSETS